MSVYGVISSVAEEGVVEKGKYKQVKQRKRIKQHRTYGAQVVNSVYGAGG